MLEDRQAWMLGMLGCPASLDARNAWMPGMLGCPACLDSLHAWMLDMLGAWQGGREQLDQLKKLKWPSLTCGSFPWASHKPLCTLHSWSVLGSSFEAGMPLLETMKHYIRMKLG
ncbi:hypothetical protein Droror1_Dr00022415 [Drosera rotundifolia]